MLNKLAGYFLIMLPFIVFLSSVFISAGWPAVLIAFGLAAGTAICLICGYILVK